MKGTEPRTLQVPQCSISTAVMYYCLHMTRSFTLTLREIIYNWRQEVPRCSPREFRLIWKRRESHKAVSHDRTAQKGSERSVSFWFLEESQPKMYWQNTFFFSNGKISQSIYKRYNACSMCDDTLNIHLYVFQEWAKIKLYSAFPQWDILFCFYSNIFLQSHNVSQ